VAYQFRLRLAGAGGSLRGAEVVGRGEGGERRGCVISGARTDDEDEAPSWRRIREIAARGPAQRALDRRDVSLNLRVAGLSVLSTERCGSHGHSVFERSHSYLEFGQTVAAYYPLPADR
jgi:hypothetical protein